MYLGNVKQTKKYNNLWDYIGKVKKNTITIPIMQLFLFLQYISFFIYTISVIIKLL